jgi:hypothetical protein
MDTLRDIGHAVLALVNAAILLAILAVILAPNSQSAAIIQQAFSLLAWLVGQVINPITGGSRITLSSTLAPAGAYGATSSASGGTQPVQAGGTGTGSSTLAPSIQSGIASAPDGTGQFPIYDQYGRIMGHSPTPGTATPE